eukprot:477800_1
MDYFQETIIQISNTLSHWINNQTFEYPVYTLQIQCKQPNTNTTFAPRNPKATKRITIIFFIGICLAVYRYSNKCYKNKKPPDDQSDIYILPSENIALPGAPIIDEDV